MKLNLGFMKIPFEGDFNHGKFVVGIVFACISVVTMFNGAEINGPAIILTGKGKNGSINLNSQVENVREALLVTAIWCIMYYNYVGVQVLTIFTQVAYEMYGPEDVTDKFRSNAARFAGNMFEQSPVFLWVFWTYVLFVDYGTGWCLGVLYLIQRALYPFYYIIIRRFTFDFENNTQIGYGVNGTLIFGLLWNGAGGNFAAWAKDNNIVAPIIGYFIGCFITLGVPYGTILTFIHYKRDHAVKMAEKAAAAADAAASDVEKATDVVPTKDAWK